MGHYYWLPCTEGTGYLQSHLCCRSWLLEKLPGRQEPGAEELPTRQELGKPCVLQPPGAEEDSVRQELDAEDAPGGQGRNNGAPACDGGCRRTRAPSEAGHPFPLQGLSMLSTDTA